MTIYSTHTPIIDLLENLDDRVAKAERLLTEVIENQLLLEVLEGAETWAIVGGAVRDAILKSQYTTSFYLGGLKDIDIALPTFPKYGPLSKTASDNSRVTITRNHFGGMKVFLPDFTSLDLWVWDNNPELTTAETFWNSHLASVDFGINAVAFIWPLKKIIMHPRWIFDLERLQIEKLAAHSPMQELQAVRAIALATKLELELGHHVHLGPNTKRDFYWLIHEAEPAKIQNAMSYLKKKVDMHRWPSQAINRLADLCIDYHCSKSIIQQVNNLSDPGKAQKSYARDLNINVNRRRRRGWGQRLSTT